MTRFYSFDYTEMKGFEIVNMGILTLQTDHSVTRDELKECVRQHLHNPSANIIISYVSKITKAEYESADDHKKVNA